MNQSDAMSELGTTPGEKGVMKEQTHNNPVGAMIIEGTPATERDAAWERAGDRSGSSAEDRARSQNAVLAAGNSASNLKLVMDVELNVTLRFGQRVLSLREVLDLSSGSVIELDRQVDEPVELLLDGRVIARGEAVVIDGCYGMRVTELPRLNAHATARGPQ